MGTSAELAPIAFRGHEQRQSPRKGVSLPFALQLASGKQAWLSDIGEGGLGVSGAVGLELGTITSLQFRLPESSSTLDMLGTVVWSDGSGRAGVRFTQVESDSAVALLHWLSSGMGTSIQTADRAQDAALEVKINCLREITELKAAISAQALDRDAALDLIVRRIAELTRASGAAIALQEGEDVVCRARVGNAPDLGVKLSSSSLSGECLRTGNAVLLEDSENDARVNPEICRELNLRSLLILPVVSGAKKVGIAEALSPNPRNFQSSDILTVSFLNDLIAGVATTEDVAEPADGITLGDFEKMVAAAQDAEEAEQKLRAQQFVSNGAPPVILHDPAEPALAPPSVESDSLHIPEVRQSQQRSFREKPRAEATIAPATDAEPRAATVAAIPELRRDAATEVVGPVHRTIQLPVIAAAIVALILAVIGITYSLRRSTVIPKPAAQTVPRSSSANPAESSSPQVPVLVGSTTPVSTESNAAKPVSRGAKSKTEAPERQPEDREVQLNSAHSALSQTANDVAPDAPAIGQIAGAPGSGIAASIVAAKTAAPELTPIQSQGVVEGKLIRKVLPQYPDMARRAGVSGDVVLSGTISTDGKLKNLNVVSGSPLLREAAMAAARQWRYSPYLLGGKPVETETHITISFHR